MHTHKHVWACTVRIYLSTAEWGYLCMIKVNVLHNYINPVIKFCNMKINIFWCSTWRLHCFSLVVQWIYTTYVAATLKPCTHRQICSREYLFAYRQMITYANWRMCTLLLVRVNFTPNAIFFLLHLHGGDQVQIPVCMYAKFANE